MKTTFLLFAALIISTATFAQTGIGTTTPDASAQLDVTSTNRGFLAPRMSEVQRLAISSPASGLLVYQTDGDYGYYYYQNSAESWFKIGTSAEATQWTTGGSNIYYNSGNVGIGTTTPVGKLGVVSSIGTEVATVADFRNGTNNAYTTMTSSGNSSTVPTWTNGSQIVEFVPYSTGDGIIDTYTGSLQLQTARYNRLTITNAGNVGIGTTAPAEKLHVLGTATTRIEVESSGSSDASFKATTPNSSYGWYADGTSDFMGLWDYNDATTRMVIDGNGRVGIGTTSPGYPLEVVGSTPNSTSSIYFNGGGTSFQSGSGPFNVTIKASNDIMASGSFVATSDMRVKENITELSNSIDLLGRLRPVSYNKIDKVEYGNRLHYGFIAQEVEEVLPEAVNTGKGEVPVLKPFENVSFEEGVEYTLLVKNGDDIKEMKYNIGEARPAGEIIVKSKTVDDFKSITYDMIFTVAVDAIQEQQVQIEDQQKQMNELKAQNVALTQKVNDFYQLKAEVEILKKAIVNQGLIAED